MSTASVAAAQSNLQRILALLDQNPLFRSQSVLANIAETFPASPPGLHPGAGDGSTPGLHLPDLGGEIDILGQTWSFRVPRIDASVTSLHLRGSGPASPGLTTAAGSTVDTAFVGEITSTTIAAANTGNILTGIQVSLDAEEIGNGIDLVPSEIAQGGVQRLNAAGTGTTDARRDTLSAAGGSTEHAILAINLASNRMEVTGAVRTVVQQQSVELATIMTTVIGAVNAGETRPH